MRPHIMPKSWHANFGWELRCSVCCNTPCKWIDNRCQRCRMRQQRERLMGLGERMLWQTRTACRMVPWRWTTFEECKYQKHFDIRLRNIFSLSRNLSMSVYVTESCVSIISYSYIVSSMVHRLRLCMFVRWIRIFPLQRSVELQPHHSWEIKQAIL